MVYKTKQKKGRGDGKKGKRSEKERKFDWKTLFRKTTFPISVQICKKKKLRAYEKISDGA
jgi:hypothetical protein